ncbi:hypothetical protein MBM_04467 [Drepanopeziza brunnea f. sp. 'multigermtubi' MB_m1]|uniref:Uncharacterized protein n=1 Tax=Marssonina brunnea f. sp. multigermtubi (strain MB_m1) TaxID=1072389 RepID=K1WX05_MARBU|nr:uncharacterized protein MBM_04467 [Drepanopeziza brunnea f. sp. 'multigermtubi' MB_m1]EKD17606.1 hypothetical protein MBM_04467 [Drepanopeziza brunnea f. sp. 'multigermtubi' MB_m1]
MPAQDNKKGAKGNPSFPASAGANAKKRHRGKRGKENGQNGTTSQIYMPRKPRELKIPRAQWNKVSTKQEEIEKLKEVKAKKARKTATAPKNNPRGGEEAKTTSVEVAVSAAGLKKRKEELDAREQDPIQQSYAYDKKEKEDASKKATKKLEDRKLKAEAKADRAAAKVAKRMERVERRQQANKEGDFIVLKPVFAGISKKKAGSKSKVPLKLSRLSADQESGDKEGEEGDEAVDDSEPCARPKLSYSVDGSPTVVRNQDDENEVNDETMEPLKFSTSSATAAPVSSAPALSTAVRPETKCTATESFDLTTIDLTEDFTGITGIPIKRYTEARKYLDERKQLAAEMKKMAEKLKKLSAREAFIEARISDMRRPVTATNGKLSCKRDKKCEPIPLSRVALSKSTLSASWTLKRTNG